MLIPGSGNKNANNLPYDAQGKRGWSFDLFSCFGDGMKACCFAWWCPCLAHAQNRRRLDHLNATGLPDPHRDDLMAEDSLLDVLVETMFAMGWVLQIVTRHNVRERYNIRGSAFRDCFTPFCCLPCDLVMNSRELRLEEDSFLSYQTQRSQQNQENQQGQQQA
ncbi:hypothetical protein NLJ89_g10958 [Agrocybe chaxingu]|uniref:Uncharacterized protein n=1 Tax=Agrocybe chaxingu TaxID=84603 RepID=A0A9W8JMT1_9AGAR|nr:hypothetical protein NLJ89_g10958 [Agrocybe chaxingu]